MVAQIESADAVVIGSGFGGSAAACRLVEEGLKVVVFERGQLYPPGSFPRSPRKMARNFWDPSAGLYGLFDIWSFRGLEGVVSSGVGGGSLIYANVLLRKDAKWFVTGGEDGEDWPVTRSDLDPHYDRIEQKLAPQKYPLTQSPYDRTGKTLALRNAAAELELDWSLPNLAVTFANAGRPPVPGEPIVEQVPNLHKRTRLTCRLCGECDIGCNEGSKNSLDHTILSEAVAQGAELRDLCEVRAIAPLPDGRFEVGYVRHELSREGHPHDTGALPQFAIHAGVVVVSAGTFGSTHLLLRSRDDLPKISDRLGTRFSSNGDLLAFIKGCRPQEVNGAAIPTDPNFGPVITSTIRIPDELDGGTGRGAYIQDGGYPYFASWLVEGANLPSFIRRFFTLAWRYVAGLLRLNTDSNLSAEVSQALGTAETSANALVMLGMGRDVAGGRMGLDGKWLDIDWPRASSRPFFDRMRDSMRNIASFLGGRLIDNPLWYLGRTVTVHPLGGCPMGRDANSGVVDSFGEVFGYPGLIVADGSVMPGPVGANPSLTIAALADRFAKRAAENWKSRSAKLGELTQEERNGTQDSPIHA